MADAVAAAPSLGDGDDAEIARWHAEGTTIGAVLEALSEQRSGEQRYATRTSVVTLVAVAADAAEAERAAEATRHLGGRHPGRTITLVLGEDEGPTRLDAQVALHVSCAEDTPIWSEEVQLRVAGAVVGHLDSLIEPLTLPDLPIVVWYVGRLPVPGDPLLGTADIVLVDTRQTPGDAVLARVLELARQRPVVDLSWLRLQPWRQLLAALFDGSVWRPFAAGVQSVTVAGKVGPRLLLAGWLSSRLHLPDAALDRRDARHVTVRLTAEAGGQRAHFTVTRRDGERLVRASATVEDGPHHSEVLPLPDASLPWSLAAALTHLERDRVHEHAVRAALGFAS